MKLLVIDTSTTSSSVALTVNGRLVAEYFASPEKTHSASLMSGLDQVMTSAGVSVDDLDVIGVTLGPGSFTGLRVGIATVKGFALASGKPIVGFSSLAMLAMNLPFAAFPVCPMLDARKDEVYTALYRCRELPDQLLDDCVVAPAAFVEKVREPTIFLGSGALRYREMILEKLGEKALFAPAACHEPRASAGALVAADLVSKKQFIPSDQLLPVYLRASEAELALLKKEMKA